MNKEKRLIKNTLIYAIGNMGSKLLTFLLIPLYTEYLSSGEYGTFDLIVNTVTLLMPLVTFQLSEGIYRYILTENDNKKIEKYISNGILVIIRNIIIFTIVYYIFCVFAVFKNKLGIYIYFVSMCLYTLWSQIARGLKKNLQYAIAGMSVTLVTMILNILFIVKFSIGINGLIYSYSLGFLVGFIYLEITTKIISFIKIKNFSRKFRGRLMKYSVPLIPNAASWWIMNVSDRYAITYLMGEAFNGIYAIANKFHQ
ncbi:oligosaccharide flippase family protein [Clostridium paraputrificum]|uniref:oligosaccharide flippase family protein n=1 Tax=Clostridium paraputrificum TaxID=29363 RepID=UPI0034A16969